MPENSAGYIYHHTQPTENIKGVTEHVSVKAELDNSPLQTLEMEGRL